MVDLLIVFLGRTLSILNYRLNLSISQVNCALCMCRDLRIVGDHHYRPTLRVKRVEQVHYFLSRS